MKRLWWRREGANYRFHATLTDNHGMPEKPDMPPSLQQALVPFIVTGLTILALWLKIDPKDNMANIYSIAVQLAALAVAGFGWLMNFFDKRKIKQAEKLVPGITDPKLLKPTEELTVTLIKNDVTNTDAATPLVYYTPPKVTDPPAPPDPQI